MICFHLIFIEPEIARWEPFERQKENGEAMISAG